MNELASHFTRRGMFVAVVGPSGAGKDSILRAAQLRLAMRSPVVFAKRIITRPANAHEDHEPIEPRLFELGLKHGDFALSWVAHGSSYGLSIETLKDVRAGSIVVANVSRDVLADAYRVYGSCRSIHITARPDILAARLAQRGRELPDDQTQRLGRSGLYSGRTFDIEIDNSGRLEDAVDRFIASLTSDPFPAPQNA